MLPTLIRAPSPKWWLDAVRQQLNLREALAWLCAAEVVSKERLVDGAAPASAERLTIAHFPFVRTWEGFAFEAQPSIDPAKIRDQASCRWVAHGDNGVLLGSLGKAQQQESLEMRLVQYTKPKLLIVDELGYLPLEHEAGHLLFQLISRRYEQESVLISSKRPVEEWHEVFGDQVVAAAILDRLLHHSPVVTIRGDSYRLLLLDRPEVMFDPGADVGVGIHDQILHRSNQGCSKSPALEGPHRYSELR